jgi:uncharacterized membrane protein
MFLTGILFLIPIAVTFWLLSFLITRTQGVARPVVEFLPADELLGEIGPGTRETLITLISLFLVLASILLIGAFANFYVGKKVLALVDRLLLKLPFVRSIYGGTKQIMDAFDLQRASGSFKKVVLLEYPRRECWVLGFVTNENLLRSKQLFGEGLIGVFVPSTPNPTTGFLLYLPPGDLHVLDLSVEEAVKLIVSAGLVLPSIEKQPPETLAHIIASQAVDANAEMAAVEQVATDAAAAADLDKPS